MATSSESDIKDSDQKSISQQALERLKQKEECPRCREKYLYSNDSSSLDSIMDFTCLRCGHSFYENEQQREYRKDNDKEDKTRNPWDSGILVLAAMLAVILAINLDRRNEIPNTQVTPPPANQLR